MTKKQLGIIVLLIALGLITRLSWHPANITALAAISIFAGFYFSRKIAWLIPISIMLISDLFLGGYELPVMISVYVSFVLATQIGAWFKGKRPGLTWLGAVILPGLIFFIITNFAIWAFTPWYVRTGAGLIQCLVAALPFWRNMAIGDAVWLGVIFSSYYAVVSVPQVILRSRLWYTKRVIS
ncbi:MAG: hypothetical protein NTV81_04675 [Candidatus Komeilibacteria bacterium]|nr:hypothetical protein [Candidatus Komeilibacteria bacterium]